MHATANVWESWVSEPHVKSTNGVAVITGQSVSRLGRFPNPALHDEVNRFSLFEETVGASAALRAVLSRVSKVAPTDCTVLLTGETGTGKEMIARAIQKRSRRPSLVASELFGHERGGFTGALQRQLGRFERAEAGTLFFDEVGELPTETQRPKLGAVFEGVVAICLE
jgi:transcriptional regulator with GAF, ATPase, and Fis domain